MDEVNKNLINKYNWTSWWYDLLDYPWERQYRKWRPELIKDIKGKVLEAGVGTGRNLKYYSKDVNLTGIELSPAMLRIANKRKKMASCSIKLLQQDATSMNEIPSNNFDWVFSTFMCCVVPNQLQPLVIKEFARILKKNGRFRLLEMVYSKNSKLKSKQKKWAPFVEKVYGARFDRLTLDFLNQSKELKVEKTYFLKRDMYLVIEGRKN